MTVNLEAEDILYGRNGSLTLKTTMDIDDVLLGDETGGVLANANNIEARVEVQNTQLMLPGQSATKLRRIGWSGTGSLRIYRYNLAFFGIMKDMIDLTKPVPVFSLFMALVNKDPDSSRAHEENIVLESVKFWSYDWMFNMTDFVELPLEFTFEGIKDAGIGST